MAMRTTTIQLARDEEAVDFERFVTELGLHARRDGTRVEILEAPDTIGGTVTSWLAQSRRPLVPTAVGRRDVVLRPPAA